MTSQTTEALKEIYQKISKRMVKLIPYLTILSGIMVWSYLNNIGRLDLLIDSFSINIGLIPLLISSVILSIAIVITLILPSSILIFHHSIFPDIIKKPIYMPLLGWGCSTLFLTLAFLPHVPCVKKIISPPSALLAITIIATLSFLIFISISLFKGDFKNNRILDKFRKVGQVLIATFIIVFATLSISLPVSLLLKNSTGEKVISLIIAWVFMVIFSLSSFLPAIVYFDDIKNTPSSSENRNGNIIPLAKKLSISVILTIITTSILFPNITSMLVNSSLYSIGVMDNKSHHFLIDGNKYQPNMFPQHLWMTSTTNKIEKSFFIYGVRIFSAGNKNLICPDSVGEFKKNINGRNYDLITSSDSEDSARKLKDMTDICVILNSDDAKQWDTFFKINSQN
ncbi:MULTISPECIES: hypothetical protein [Xenorhabdus]|uniref:hypothetical protein n=1 Tax=Xenorhabdus TaxID=626 RepID=UPI000AB08C22|nr:MULTISPECIES: hypothetical protein [Xenorhabdus]